MKMNLTKHGHFLSAEDQAPLRSNRILFNLFSVLAGLLIAVGAIGCASQKPVSTSNPPLSSTGLPPLDATVLVQVVPSYERPAVVPGSGIAGSIRFVPPKEYFEANTLSAMVRASLEQAGLFANVRDSSQDNGTTPSDFILEVIFGEITLGMDFMGEGVMVDFPSNWQLLTKAGRKVVLSETVKAHGAGNSLSVKAVSKKAMERAIRDAMAKGISSIHKQIASAIRQGEPLELLASARATPETDRNLLNAIAANSSPVALSLALNKVSSPPVKSAAQSRLEQVILASTNLAELVWLSDKSFDALGNFKASARQRVASLLNQWRSAADEGVIHLLFSVGNDPWLSGNDLASLSMQTGEAILKVTHEVISEDTYQRDFRSPKGGLLYPWIQQLRGQMATGQWPEGSPTTFMVFDNSGQVVRFLSSKASLDMRNAPGLALLTFAMDSLNYTFEENLTTKLVQETVSRRSADNQQTLITEVILLRGVRYRKCKTV